MQGTIVFKKRELLVPEDYLTKVLKARPDGLGYALHPISDKRPRILLERGDGRFSVKDIMDIQNAAVDDELIIWFFAAGKHHLEDLMPMTIMGDETTDDGPDIVGFADGSFPNFIPQASSHTNEYFLFNKYLIPKLTRLGDNPNAIFNALEDDLVKMELTGLGGHIVFLSSTGRWIPFGDGRREFEWGWTTDAHGYDAIPKKDEPAITAAAKKVGQMLQRKLVKQADDRLPAKDTTIKHIASVEPIKQPPKTDTAVPKEETVTKTFTPEKGLSRKQLKKEYKKVTGTLPSNWKDKPTVEYKSTVLKDFKDLDKYATQVSKEEAAVTDKELPIMAPKLLKSLEAEKYGDNNSTTIPNPETILKDMEKFPDFWEETGIPQNVTDGWDWSTFRNFAEKYPIACAKLAWSYRNNEVTDDQEDQFEPPIKDMDTSGTGVAEEEDVPASASQAADKPVPRKQPQMLKRKAM